MQIVVAASDLGARTIARCTISTVELAEVSVKCGGSPAHTAVAPAEASASEERVVYHRTRGRTSPGFSIYRTFGRHFTA